MTFHTLQSNRISAKAEGLIIVTKDTDFYDRILLEGEPPKVVWIRTGNIKRKELKAIILNVWEDVEKHLSNYALIEIYEDCIEGIKKPVSL